MTNQKIQNAIEDRAARDGAFAIAYAINRLADAQSETARALERLGVNGASTSMGALEALGLEVSRIADALGASPSPLG